MSQVHTQPPISPIHDRSYASSEEIKTLKGSLRDLKSNCTPFPFPAFASAQKYEGLGWNTPPLSHPVSPMPDRRSHGAHEVPSTRVGDVYQARSGIDQKPAREQLPPLSSIFTTPRQGFSPRSSYSDQSPTLPTLSPQNARQSSTLQQPPWELPYSQGRSSTSQLILSRHSHGARSPPSELPPPLRQMQINQLSPHPYDVHCSSQEDGIPSNGSRTQLSISRTDWSPRPEQPYRDYFATAQKDSSFRPQLDQQQYFQASSHPRREGTAPKEVRRETLQDAAPTTPQYPPATTLTAAVQEPGTSRDALGPKIWTGSQFLPRFVRQAEIPGEGLCYFYDDGTHCKTHIDGEAVNAHWGVTKAGKPRKRLAIACITCREKKIKCDPDYPRCIQCEKFGRVCKFKNAPRGNQGSPEAPADADEVLLRPLSQQPDRQSHRPEKREFAQSTSPQSNNRRRPSSGSGTNPAKRQKFDDGSTSTKVENKRAYLSPKGSPPPSRRPSGDAIVERSRRSNVIQWVADPLDADEELLIELMNVYFIHLTSTTVCMFPRKPFMLWLTDRCTRKSADDLMLIHAMLAMSTVFSSNPDHKERGKEFAAISRYSCDRRHFSLQLAQSRLLLALYYFAVGNQNDCWDFCGAALRVAIGMELNLEMEKTQENDASFFPYNLNRNGYAECRRRTFWSCYIVDRFQSFCSGHLSMIHPEDIFLRLPCDVRSFEEQCEIHNPYFDLSTPPIQNSRGTVGPMAYLVNIISIWGDIMANIYRTSKGIFAADTTAFKNFYEAIASRLEAWHSSLPDCVSFSPENLVKASHAGILGTFITIHSLYQSAKMKLDRHVNPDILSSEQLETHVRRAHHHAEALLQLADSLANRHIIAGKGTAPRDKDGTSIPFSSPFIGFAIVCAVDTLSVKGYLSKLPRSPPRMQGAMRVLDELAKCWHSAQNQKELVSARLADLVVVPIG